MPDQRQVIGNLRRVRGKSIEGRREGLGARPFGVYVTRFINKTKQQKKKEERGEGRKKKTDVFSESESGGEGCTWPRRSEIRALAAC